MNEQVEIHMAGLHNCLVDRSNEDQTGSHPDGAPGDVTQIS